MNKVPLSRRVRARRGLAMIETVMALPFLLIVLALVIFFGFGMIRLQRIASVDRYEAWRAQAYAPGPHIPAVNTDGGANERYNTDEVRSAFYGRDAPRDLVAQVSIPDDSAANEAAEALMGAIANAGANEQYAAAILRSPRSGLPISRRVTLHAEHAARSKFEESMSRVFEHHHTRPDGDWRYVNDVLDLPNEQWYDRTGDDVLPLYPSGTLASGIDRPRRLATPALAVRDVAFRGQSGFAGLDDLLEPLSGINPLARTIQSFYLRVPGYRGPKLPTRAERDGDGEWVFTY